jgi:hypothetical protein
MGNWGLGSFRPKSSAKLSSFLDSEDPEQQFWVEWGLRELGVNA